MVLLIQFISSSALTVPQGMERAPVKPTGSYYVKLLSLLVKKLYVSSDVKVSHGCVLGEKTPLLYKIECNSISGTNG